MAGTVVTNLEIRGRVLWGMALDFTEWRFHR